MTFSLTELLQILNRGHGATLGINAHGIPVMIVPGVASLEEVQAAQAAWRYAYGRVKWVFYVGVTDDCVQEVLRGKQRTYPGEGVD